MFFFVHDIRPKQDILLAIYSRRNSRVKYRDRCLSLSSFPVGVWRSFSSKSVWNEIGESGIVFPFVCRAHRWFSSKEKNNLAAAWWGSVSVTRLDFPWKDSRWICVLPTWNGCALAVQSKPSRQAWTLLLANIPTIHNWHAS